MTEREKDNSAVDNSNVSDSHKEAMLNYNVLE